MANRNAPSGARPLRHLTGGNSFRMNPYPVDASNTVAVFIGDFVMLEADGNIAPATAGSVIQGVVGGVAGDYDDLTRRYLPASTAGTVLVYDDPDIVFAIQEDSDASTLAAADRGLRADHIAGAGSTTTGVSAHEIDSSDKATGDGGLRLLKIVDRADNAIGANAEWEVLIAQHRLIPSDVAAGI